MVICLMILVILSLMGAAALMTSSTETKIAHNARKADQTFFTADSGVEVAMGVVSYFARNKPDPAGFPANLRADLQTIVQDQYLLNELMGFASPNDGATDNPEGNPDILMTIGGRQVTVDIDRLNELSSFGEALEGGGGRGSGPTVFYRAHAEGQEAGSRAGVEIVYRFVI